MLHETLKYSTLFFIFNFLIIIIRVNLNEKVRIEIKTAKFSIGTKIILKLYVFYKHSIFSRCTKD